MMDFKRLLNSKFGKIIVSILLGLGLASLFRKACKDRKCLKFVGPDITKVDGKVFKFDNKCFSYKPVASSCKSHKKQLDFS
jgi:hypothetical protein